MTILARGHSYSDSSTGAVLDAWFPALSIEPVRYSLAEELGLTVRTEVSVEIASLDDPPENAIDVYLRLHLLSRCEVEPNKVNLDGIFGLLTNVAWTTAGPVLPTRLDELRSRVAPHRHVLLVSSIDKFPRMTDYVAPVEVRIGDADRVRLGAHLAAGTCDPKPTDIVNKTYVLVIDSLSSGSGFLLIALSVWPIAWLCLHAYRYDGHT